MSKKVSFKTLGCKLNFSETSTIAREFRERGFETTPFGNPADVVFINTCTVTGMADKKCRQAIQQAKNNSPDAFIVVTGCYAQAEAAKIAQIKGVDMVLGMNEKFNFFKYADFSGKKGRSQVYSCEAEHIIRFDSAFSSSDRTRSFLKVQDGCDFPCTYCTIPSVRGKSRSDSIDNTVKQAEEIAKKGFKEIILTGVNIGDFGKGNNESFYGLIKALDKVKGIERYRISSVEPNLLTDNIIHFVTHSYKFLPHFHIPLQSGSDKLLNLMKRRYSATFFRKKIEQINKLIPEAFIGVDVITGFPGEGENEFNESYQFLESLEISFIHTFSYSMRKGTPAENMPGHVSSKEIKSRSLQLHQLSEIKHKKFYAQFIGTEHKVLFESSEKGKLIFGFTENYIKTAVPYNQSLINLIQPVKILSINDKGFANGILR